MKKLFVAALAALTLGFAVPQTANAEVVKKDLKIMTSWMIEDADGKTIVYFEKTTGAIIGIWSYNSKGECVRAWVRS